MALTLLGSTASFTQLGGGRWIISDFGLDTLVERWQGARSELATFLATLTKWQANGTDANMFLASWDDDGHEYKPTVTLTYVGFRGGVLPAASVTIGSGPAAAGKSTDSSSIDVEYIAPNETTRWFSTSQAQRPLLGTRIPGSHYAAYGIVVLRVATGASSESPAGPALPTVFGTFDIQNTLVGFQSEEVVPGHYWQNTKTTAWHFVD